MSQFSFLQEMEKKMNNKRLEIYKKLTDLGKKITNLNISELQKLDNRKENLSLIHI